MSVSNISSQKPAKKSKRLSRLALSTCSASLLMLAPVAHAQIVIEDGRMTPVENPGGQTVTIGEGVTQTVDDGDNIELENNTNDGTVIDNSGTLINNDGDDEDVVIFIDNSEDDVVINNTATGILQGFDGVIFQEGDGLTLTNAGVIEGTGEANEGVIYYDRDSDSNVNSITNSGTITGVGGPTIGIDTLLGSVGGDEDTATAADPVTFAGTATIVIDNSGTISNTGTGSNADAINFNGDPGDTSEGSISGSSSDSPRGCIENIAGADTAQVNCQVNFTLTNSGTISTASTDTGSAAIRAESDAVINGSITNTADGVITGASRGIYINGAHSDHDLDINNAGTISGTGEGAVGLLITGAGVDVANTGTISGTDVGLQVASTTITVREADRTAANNAHVVAGVSTDVPDVAVAAINNTFVNSGTISGATASVDLSGAGEAVTFEQQGGALTGDFLGSTGFTDQINFTTSDFVLTHDILQSVNVGVAGGVSLSFDGEGARMIEGNLVSDGDLAFDIGDAATVVTGDVTLNTDSTVSIADAGTVRAIDTNYTLIDVGGTLTNNATLVNQIEDSSFLLDFETVAGSQDLVVRAVAATGGGGSGGDDTEVDDDAMVIASCDDIPLSNPAMGDGANVVVDVNATCTVADGDVIVLENNSQDDTSIRIASGTILVSTDGDDEDTVIFIDNSEDDIVVNIDEGATLQGEDGVIFQEGDGLTLTNAGVIEGTGAANEGVIYYDRDSDSNVNSITNSGTITGVGGPTIGIDTLLGSVGGDEDTATAADPVTFAGTATIVIDNSGTISNTGTGSNADAINFNGDPGNTSEGSLGGSSDNPRGCIENIAGSDMAQVNCQVNFTLTNSGTISTASTDTGSAAIRAESDAVINGSITNTADGVITGASRGIYINGAHADHDLDITNAGTISGTGEGAVGLLITGAGVDVNNSGTISGTDYGLVVNSSTITVREVDRTAENNASVGDRRDVADVAVAAVNNTFVNSGTISGGNASVNLSGAGEAVTFEQQGGALTGDFLGSTGFTDQLNFTSSDFVLTHDILQSVNVDVASGVSLSFGGEGARTIDGNLVSDGDLSFDIGNAATVVTGDVTLNTGSTVTIADVGNVRAFDTNYTLIDVGGSLTNNASLVSQVEDDSFLINFEVVEGSEDLVVRAIFNQPEIEVTNILSSLTDPNASRFGESVISAFNAGSLNNTDAFSALAGFSTQGEVEAEVNRLIPSVNNVSVQETSQALGTVGSLIDERIHDLATSDNFSNQTTRYASNGLNSIAGGQNAFAGAWTRGSYQRGDQDNRSGDFGLNDGYDSNTLNLAVGYDVALGDEALIGLSGGYVRVTTESDRDSNDGIDLDLFQLTGYGATLIQGWKVSAQASYAVGEAETQRQAFELITGQYDVDALTIEGQVSKALDFGDSNYLAPYAGLRYSSIGTDAYTETGGLDVSIDDTDADYLQGRAGLTIGHKFIKPDSSADLFAGLGVVNEFNDGSTALDIAFADQALRLNSAEVDDLRVNPSVGFNWSSTEGVAVGAIGEAEFGDTYSAYSVSARVKFAF